MRQEYDSCSVEMTMGRVSRPQTKPADKPLATAGDARRPAPSTFRTPIHKRKRGARGIGTRAMHMGLRTDHTSNSVIPLHIPRAAKKEHIGNRNKPCTNCLSTGSGSRRVSPGTRRESWQRRVARWQLRRI
jgi:hypothetical protein